ncbi:hypothetical protein [Glaciimonas immobilis]|uniref:Uncharacterized protein n=1 Tax=Glaciimonas immobilis TaxID=728004 RepID=A0A840RTZ3_9BURK|nr:hypothetical protein [Glaciimonas immobilis]KAF3999706.1 hypothetical protein HAV38_00455 [Glaciimonas immobilis]MBB5200154.1 hypothetical protein [Glaciimonas immobilis]
MRDGTCFCVNVGGMLLRLDDAIVQCDPFALATVQRHLATSLGAPISSANVAE